MSTEVQVSPSVYLAIQSLSKNKKQKQKQQSGDLIVQTVTEIEQIDKALAFSLVEQLSENVEYTYFRLGGVLSVIQRNVWYHDEGYETFKDFVESKFGLHYRKAMYLVAIYNGLAESGVPWDKVKGIGWTKLKELANILTTENVDKYVEAAESMTTIQLIEFIKNETKPEKKGEDAVESTPDLTSMSFKIHSDQKETIRAALDQGKSDTGSEYDAVALEHICIAYISGGGKKVVPTKSLTQIVKDEGIQKVMNAIEQVFPQYNITVEEID